MLWLKSKVSGMSSRGIEENEPESNESADAITN